MDEGKKVNDSLKAYQIKYDQQLHDLDVELGDTFDQEQEYQDNEYKRGYDRMFHLENMLKKERDDRIRTLDEHLAPIHAQMQKNFVDLD